MTIAAGFRCNEGVVICADTEETVGDTKQWRGKIETIVYPGLKHVICFAGAGWTDYVLTAMEKAREGLGECNGMNEIRDHLKEKLIGFFDGHLANWAYFPANERPFVELLIGVTTTVGGLGLFYYGGTAFYETSEKTIGSGIILANNLISEHRTHKESLEQLCRLSIFVLSRVKKQVVGCGGDTHLVALRKGADFAWSEDDDVRSVEAELQEQLKQSNAQFATAMDSCNPLHLLWHSDRKEAIKAEPST
ncbi:MAG: hypothetical protein ABSA41_12960 [Terriglobia bacterium]